MSGASSILSGESMDYISERLPQLIDFWGRGPDASLNIGGNRSFQVLRFPPVEKVCPGHVDTVFMTLGMSRYELKPSKEKGPSRIELTAFGWASDSPESILALSMLSWVARDALKEGEAYAQGDFFNWGGPLVGDSEMSAFHFAGFPDARETLEDRRDDLLKAIDGAEDVLNLIPVSESEWELAASQGIREFHYWMDRKGIDATFDLTRETS